MRWNEFWCPGLSPSRSLARRMEFLVVLAAFLLLVPSIGAHHGLARFDTTHIVTMHGTVTDFQWINPHTYIYADLTDDHGKTANWSLECGSLAMLSRFGWSATTVKRGDRVTVEGFLAKDHSAYMSLQRIGLPNGKVLPGAP